MSYKVKALNSGSVLDIGNVSQSGPPLYVGALGRYATHQVYNGTKGSKVAHHCVEKPISGI